MTAGEFNLKYKDYIEIGFDGLQLEAPTLADWLDIKFQNFITIKGFKFSQIKAKFGYGRFYCQGITDDEVREIEEYITNYFK